MNHLPLKYEQLDTGVNVEAQWFGRTLNMPQFFSIQKYRSRYNAGFYCQITVIKQGVKIVNYLVLTKNRPEHGSSILAFQSVIVLSILILHYNMYYFAL